MNINIINEPEHAKDYEFIVARPIGDDDYFFEACYENGFEAEKRANEIGGIIFHNVRIQGKRRPAPKKPKLKYFKVEYTLADVIEAVDAEHAEAIFFTNMSDGCYDADPSTEEITKEEYENFWS